VRHGPLSRATVRLDSCPPRRGSYVAEARCNSLQPEAVRVAAESSVWEGPAMMVRVHMQESAKPGCRAPGATVRRALRHHELLVAATLSMAVLAAVAVLAAACGGGGGGGGGTLPTTSSTTSSGGGAVATGQGLYQSLGCVNCHSIDGSARTGPTWKGLAGSKVQLTNGQTVVANRTYLMNSIETPDKQTVAGYQPGIMSSVIAPHSVSQADANALIAFIQSLK
jgi:cytochrome c551/c552